MIARPLALIGLSAALGAVAGSSVVVPVEAARDEQPSVCASPKTDICAVGPGTVLTEADSPYRATCDLVVPAGTTLRMEPGSALCMGPSQTLTVDGTLHAVGTADKPIRITALELNRPWVGALLSATSGASEIGYVALSDNGARRRALLELHSSATVHHASFTNAGGVAIDILDGASPTIRDSAFINAADPNARPQGALRIMAGSHARILSNFFRSNANYPVYQDAAANPELDGNRFELNGWNGILVSGAVTGQTRLTSLGPRRWGYWIDTRGVAVRPGATLEIGPGTTLRVDSNAFNVEGTLQIRGQAGAKVLITASSQQPEPGSWRAIDFAASSTPYDPATGSGSFIDHSVIEYGGADPIGVISIRGASPRISNTLLRYVGTRGITASGAGARPVLIGNRFDSLTAADSGVGIAASGSASPLIAFNVFQFNRTAIISEIGAHPVIEPYNRFDRSIEFAVINRDPTTCLEAKDNDWLSPDGPADLSFIEDQCGLAGNDTQGDLVSDNVRYKPWSGQLPRPSITLPTCGTLRDEAVAIEGLASPASTVIVYDNWQPIGQAMAEPGTGELAVFRFQTQGLAPGSHVLAVRTEQGERRSGMSDPREINITPGELIDASRLYASYELDGTHYAQPLNDLTGCSSLVGGEWEVRVHPDTANPNVAARTTLHVPVECPAGGAAVTLLYQGGELPFTDVGGGLFELTFDPGPGGGMDLRVACGGSTSEIGLGTLSLEFDGFVYNADSSVDPPFLDRVGGASITLYELTSGGWAAWNGAATFGQQNPQTTGSFGWYGFYPRPGLYRVIVRRSGYSPFTSAPVSVAGEPVVVTVGLHEVPRIFLPITLDRDRP